MNKTIKIFIWKGGKWQPYKITSEGKATLAAEPAASGAPFLPTLASAARSVLRFCRRPDRMLG